MSEEKKITDKVSDERLREMFAARLQEIEKAQARKREAGAKKRDPEGSIDLYIAMLTEHASIYNELLSARTALNMIDADIRTAAEKLRTT